MHLMEKISKRKKNTAKTNTDPNPKPVHLWPSSEIYIFSRAKKSRGVTPATCMNVWKKEKKEVLA